MSIKGQSSSSQSMVQAATRLADAAAQLSTAAQALSVAAGMLRASNRPPRSLGPEKPSASGKDQFTVDQGTLGGTLVPPAPPAPAHHQLYIPFPPSPTVAPLAMNRLDGGTHPLEESLDPETTSCRSPERGNPVRDHSAARQRKGRIDDVQEQIGSPMPVSQNQNNQNPSHPSRITIFRLISMNSIEAALASILTDSDADVLPTTCFVIASLMNVVCYMNCERKVLDIYKHLIEGACGITVYIAPEDLSLHAKFFEPQLLHSRKYVILFPESFGPSDRFSASPDLCVIHIGWPADEGQYKKQVDSCDASTHIIIACREDVNLYPSGPSIIQGTQPWPVNNETDELHATFNQALSEISDRGKEHVYLDWILSHGPSGRRYVKTWDTVTLVYRANLYLLDVLHYNGGDLGSSTGEFQVLLPRVTSEFIAQNNLELAVEQGVLNVLDEKSAHGASSSPKPPQDAILLNEPDTLSNTSRPESQHNSPNETTNSDITTESDLGVNQPPSVFEPVLGYHYIAIEEEFDAIPLICFLVRHHGRALCFMDDDAMLVHHKSLLNQLIEHEIYYPAVFKNDEAMSTAVEGFLSHPGKAIFLATSHAKKLPLRICAGVETPPTYFLQFGDKHSLLADMRAKLESVLVSNKGLVEKLYNARLYSMGRIPRRALDAETLVQRLNNYSAKFLLHGDADDGNETFKPIGDRPAVSRKQIEKFGLQPVVELGLLSVK
ncbi:hypothetical protein RhiJN_18442 [Ceratobasidium sp. AG-Ba]|nr:hypothetical protein RhiJN_18442 [Ceratobasidium sp. AG-Ba]